MWLKVTYVFGANVALVLLYFMYKLLRKAFITWQARKDRTYNVFDRPELSAREKFTMRGWKFQIPSALSELVHEKVIEEHNDHEVQLHFKKSDSISIVKTNNAIPTCNLFRYFELECVENIDDVPVYVGLIEENAKFEP